jgi:hypothetical protein
VAIAEQVVAGVITEAAADGLRERYTALYRAHQATQEKERDGVEKLREVRTQIREEQIALEKLQIVLQPRVFIVVQLLLQLIVLDGFNLISVQ